MCGGSHHWNVRDTLSSRRLGCIQFSKLSIPTTRVRLRGSMEQKFRTRNFSISDIKEWDAQGTLVLAPKFQRREVWNPKARSYLMDTIIRGKPIPKIYMRQRLEPQTKKIIREVVDGQQRLRTVLSFLKDGFPIDKAHSEDYAKKSFSELDESVQDDITAYEFVIDLLPNVSDDEIYDIFARLNTYSYKLKPQELRHAKFFGDFRTCAYKLANEFTTFWIENKIISKVGMLRMDEAEFVSDLLITMSDGIKERAKKVIDFYYEEYDDRFPHRSTYENRFRQTMDIIGGIMNDRIPQTNFKNKVLFFPLFCAVYHMQFKLPELNVRQVSIKQQSYSKIAAALQQVDTIFRKIKEEKDTQRLASLTAGQRSFYKAFSEYSVRADNRQYLIEYICRLISQGASKSTNGTK